MLRLAQSRWNEIACAIIFSLLGNINWAPNAHNCSQSPNRLHKSSVMFQYFFIVHILSLLFENSLTVIFLRTHLMDFLVYSLNRIQAIFFQHKITRGNSNEVFTALYGFSWNRSRHKPPNCRRKQRCGGWLYCAAWWAIFKTSLPRILGRCQLVC